MNFIKYIIRYFTHITPIYLPKKGIMEFDKWYTVSFYAKILKDGSSYFDEINIRSIPPEKEKL